MGSVFPITKVRPDGSKLTRWRASISIGPRGNRRYVTRTEGSRQAALKALADLRDENAGSPSLTTLDLGEYLRRWLDESAKPTISANTYRGYNDVLTHHLKPIAGIPLRRLTAEDIEWALGQMTTHRHGAKSQRVAAPKTIRNAQLMLRRALGQAEQRGHVAHNVARQVPLRRVPRRSRDAMTADLARQILDVTAGDQYAAAVALALVGLRISEILGLRRSDVRLDAKVPTIDVRVQLVGSGKRASVAQLKSKASEAPLPLPAFVADRLRAHLDAQPATLGDSLVFTTTDGYAVNATWLTKRFAAQMEAAGLPRMTLHALRHGEASILAALGVHPSIAQRLLRHASSSTTLDVYTHVSVDQVRAAVDQYEKAVTG